MVINCVAYQEGARLIGYLDRPGCFVWVALRDPTPKELDAMRLEFNLHPLAVEDACHGHQLHVVALQARPLAVTTTFS